MYLAMTYRKFSFSPWESTALQTNPDPGFTFIWGMNEKGMFCTLCSQHTKFQLQVALRIDKSLLPVFRTRKESHLMDSQGAKETRAT